MYITKISNDIRVKIKASKCIIFISKTTATKNIDLFTLFDKIFNARHSMHILYN